MEPEKLPFNPIPLDQQERTPYAQGAVVSPQPLKPEGRLRSLFPGSRASKWGARQGLSNRTRWLLRLSLILFILLALGIGLWLFTRTYHKPTPAQQTPTIQQNNVTELTDKHLTVNVPLRVTQSTTLNTLTVTGSSLFQGPATFQSSVDLQNGLKVTGDASISGNLIVDGTINGKQIPGGLIGAKGDTGPMGTSGCIDSKCVSLQGTSPGTQEAGNVNISGTIQAGGNFALSGAANIGGMLTSGDILPQIAGTGTAAEHSYVNSNVLDTAYEAGEYTTAMVMGPDGFSRVAYSVWNTDEFKFTRCTSKDCTQKVSNTLETGLNTYSGDMVLGADGFARITYFDQNDYSAHFIRCLDIDCSAHNDAVIEAGSNWSNAYGYYTIAMQMGTDGFPRIAYDSYGDNTIHYARCTDADCSSPVISIPITDNYNPYYYTLDMKLGSDGLPRIVYLSNNDYYLHLVRCTDADCTSPVNTAVDYDGDEYPGYYGIRMQMGTDGLPRIAYVDDNYYHLFYLTCSNQDCSSYGKKEFGQANEYMVYDGNETGIRFVLSSDNTPHFAYEDYNNYVLHHLDCTDPSCASYTDSVLDGSSYSGYDGLAMAIDSSNSVHVVYTEENNYYLHYAYIQPEVPAAVTGGTNIGTDTVPFGNIFTHALKVKTKLTTNDIQPLTPGGITNGVFHRQLQYTDETYGQGMVLGSDGYARFAFSDDNYSQLWYGRCTDANCTSPVITAITGQYESYDGYLGSHTLTIGSDGFARIVYADYNDYSLKMVRCLDTDCTTKTTTVIATDGGNGFQYNYPGEDGATITMGADGFPRIAYEYYDWGNTYNYTANYVRCTDADCTSPVTNQIGYVTGEEVYISNIVVGTDGFARLVYEDYNDYTLKLARCTDADCSSPIVTTVDANSSIDPGYYGSVIRMGPDGFLRIAYVDDNNYSVWYATCTDADCTSPTITKLTQSDGDMYGGIGMDLNTAGNASIAYEGNDDKAHLIQCSNSTCTAYGDVLLDSSTTYAMEYGASVVIGSDGLPQVLYSDSDNYYINFARLLNPAGKTTITIGSSIGSAGASFGNAYVQGINVTQGLPNQPAISINQQAADGITTLLVNQINDSGNTNTIADFQANGVSVASIDNNGHLKVNSCTGCSSSNQWQQNGSSIYYNGGNVGIGTSNPTHTLEVSGLVAVFGLSTGGNVTIGDTAGITTPTKLGLRPYGSNVVVQVIQGASGQTGDLLQFQNSSGSVIAKFGANGDLTTTHAVNLGGNTLFDSSPRLTFGGDTDTGFYQPYAEDGEVTFESNGVLAYDVKGSNLAVGAQANGASTLSATANSGNSTILALNQTLFTSAEFIHAAPYASAALFTVKNNGGTTIGTDTLGTNTRLIVNPFSTVDNLAAAQINTGGASNKGLVVQGVSSQSGDLLQLQNSSGTALTKFDSGGNLNIGNTGTAVGQLYVSGTVPSSAKSTVATGTGSAGVFAQGRYIYELNNTSNTLRIFDASNPSNPTALGSVATNDGPLAVFVAGNYAYVTTRGAATSNFEIFDISNPQSPVLKSNTVVSGNGGVYGVYVQGQYAYVTNTDPSVSKLKIYDVSNPANPILLSATATANGEPWDVYVQGHFAYVVNQGGGGASSFQIFDVSNPASPTSVGSLSTGSGTNPVGVYVQGRYAYIVFGSSSNFQIIDVSNPASPTSVSTTSVNFACSVYVQDRYAYIAGNGNMYVMDVSNPASPTQVGTAPAAGACGLHVQGRYAYVTGSNNLYTFDLGGTYTQQLQVGGLEASTLETSQNLTVNNDATVHGGMVVGSSLQVGAGEAISTGSAGATGLVINAAASQTADLLQAKDSTGTVLAKIDSGGNLTVKNAIINGTLTVNGHIITGNASGAATMNVTLGAGATCTSGGSASISLTSNDTSGTVTINSGTGAGCAAGTLVTVSFGTNFGNAPHIVLTPGNANAAGLQYYRGTATNQFTVNSGNAPAASTTYIYDYHIEQ